MTCLLSNPMYYGDMQDNHRKVIQTLKFDI